MLCLCVSVCLLPLFSLFPLPPLFLCPPLLLLPLTLFLVVFFFFFRLLSSFSSLPLPVFSLPLVRRRCGVSPFDVLTSLPCSVSGPPVGRFFFLFSSLGWGCRLLPQFPSPFVGASERAGFPIPPLLAPQGGLASLASLALTFAWVQGLQPQLLPPFFAAAPRPAKQHASPVQCSAFLPFLRLPTAAARLLQLGAVNFEAVFRPAGLVLGPSTDDSRLSAF